LSETIKPAGTTLLWTSDEGDIHPFVLWKAKVLRNKYALHSKDPVARQEWFKHITNHVARSHWQSESHLLPSSFLDVEVSRDQSNLFNPTPKDVIVGYILHSLKGEGRVKKLAKRRMDLIAGSVVSFSRLLNFLERL
jgi:hypothetical protein